jgi:hypothetical protein
LVSPAWSALIVQVPTVTRVTVVPETVQTLVVADVNVTARAEDAVALTVTGLWSSRLVASVAKVIVWLPLLIVKLCWTWDAAFQLVLPAWSALIVQVPTVTKVTVVPDTVQTLVVADVMVTARAEEAVALTVTGPWSKRLSASAAKVIVWLPLLIVKPRCTCMAAFQLVLPAWSALIVQVPTVTKVTVVPDTVQTLVVADVMVTASPEEAVALTVTGPWSKRLSASAAKVIVWLPLLIVKPCWTWDAAFQLALPAWSALMVQVPTVTKVTVVPETVQTLVVAEVKATVRLEEAVAPSVIGPSSKRLPASVPKVID